MNAIASPCWSTSSFGAAIETSPVELSALGEHLRLCRSLHSRLFSLRCLAESLNGFVSSRFVTTLSLVALAVLAPALLL